MFPSRPRLAVSACLLGREVRYDGRHKRAAWLVEAAAPHVELWPVCPEVEAGLGVPREPMRVEARWAGQAGPAALALVGRETGTDFTARFGAFVRERVARLASEHLAGFVLQERSPSCGVAGVPLHDVGANRGDANAEPRLEGQGFFAAALVAATPWLPVAEHRDLSSFAPRAGWFTRVFACWRVQSLIARRPGRADWVAFHTREKMLLQAHHEASYRELGRLAARQAEFPADAFGAEYRGLFMAALAREPTVGSRVGALEHMAGWMKERLSVAARDELLAAIRDFRRGVCNHEVPAELLRRHAVATERALVRDQTYLAPFPEALRQELEQFGP